VGDVVVGDIELVGDVVVCDIGLVCDVVGGDIEIVCDVGDIEFAGDIGDTELVGDVFIGGIIYNISQSIVQMQKDCIQTDIKDRTYHAERYVETSFG